MSWGAHPHTLAIAILLVAVGLTFWPSIQNGFVWDDNGTILGNPRLQSPAGLTSLLVSSLGGIGTNSQEPSRSFYRPIVSASYAIDHAAWGLNPQGFHLTNLLLHACVCLLVYAFAVRLSLSPALALTGALIFAVHPVHVENVAWISGRTDLFAALFILAAFLAFSRWAHRFSGGGMALCLSAILYALALASKEVALCFPLLALLCFFLTERTRPASCLRWPLALFAAVTGLYLVARLAILGQLVGPARFGTPWERIASIPWVIARYAGLLLHLQAPNPHHADTLVSSLADARLWIGLLATGPVIALSMLWIRRRRNLPLLALLWTVASLLPVLKLGTFGDVLLADRFLYVPSIGFAIGISLTVGHALLPAEKRRPLRPLFLLLLAIFILTLSVDAQARVRVWKDNLTLFRHAASASPQSASVNLNLGHAYAGDGALPRAIDAYLAAIRQDPDYADAYTSLGNTLNLSGRHADAIACFGRARQLGDTSHVLFAGLGHAYRQIGELDHARSAYQHALSRLETAAVHNNLGECLLAASNYPAARLHFDAAYRLDPTPAACNNIALWNLQQGHNAGALDWLEKALACGPPHNPAEAFSIDYNLARVLDRLCQHDRAVLHAQRALSVFAAVEQQPGADAVHAELEALAAAQPGAHPTTNVHTDLNDGTRRIEHAMEVDNQ